MHSRRVRIALAVLVLAVVGLGGRQLFLWRYPEIAVDPAAELDPERIYTINVWVETG